MRTEVMQDGQTIKVTMADGREYTFKSSESLGKVLAVRPYGKKLLIIREFGLETFQTALDLSRFRLTVKSRFTRRVMNLKQVDYILKRRKRNVTRGNSSILVSGPSAST